MNKKVFTLAEKDPTQNPPLILGEGEIVGEFMSHTSSGRVKKFFFPLKNGYQSFFHQSVLNDMEKF